MIEINLVPDVKQEFIRAQRIRATVISVSILTTLIAGGIVTVMALYVFGGQTLRSSLADSAISSESEKLQTVEDIDNVLTIQNQLMKLSETHETKNIDSRLFDVLSTIVPPSPNNVQVSRIQVNSEDATITIDAQANNGYPALEVFRKTIAATNFEYDGDGERIVVPLATEIADSNRSYGEDESGKKVLRFTIVFTYPQELFARSSTSAVIVGPERRNATDSFRGVPDSLFTERAVDANGGEGGE